jgi:hypothetical protein
MEKKRERERERERKRKVDLREIEVEGRGAEERGGVCGRLLRRQRERRQRASLQVHPHVRRLRIHSEIPFDTFREGSSEDAW